MDNKHKRPAYRFFRRWSSFRGVVHVGFLLLAVTVIAGITPVAARFATRDISPMLIPFFRFGTAGLLLGVTVKAAGLWRPIAGRHWPRLAALGFLCVPVNQMGYLYGIKKANASHAGIAYALVPLLVFWISLALRRTVWSWRLGLASTLAFAGAAVVVRATASAVASEASTMQVLAGDALLLSAAMSWSLFVVLSQPLVHELGAVLTLCAVFVLGTLWHLPFSLGYWLSSEAAFSPMEVSRAGWLGLAYLTLITAYLNYLLWYVVTSRYDVTRSAVVTNAHFLVTVLLEASLFEMNIGLSAFLGSAILFGGIVLATQRRVERSGARVSASPESPTTS